MNCRKPGELDRLCVRLLFLMTYNLPMQLQVNGEAREFPDGLNLSTLVAQLGMKADRVAVELNLEIVPRANWENTALKNGDKLEIVHFVGGGASPPDFFLSENKFFLFRLTILVPPLK